ncbi:solute carrier organic anion transporter family member 1C1-like [Carcharodon carcharias]|uniref:solute carrier organic anion transporter family member 1C1-like n=1 Tax=Carcharodon carcharias TaxID=13397 RepID=UPI001B7F0F1F|nr:solute carrier organic anion transporter family member 1C1-like [Carcharodon carcharias]
MENPVKENVPSRTDLPPATQKRFNNVKLFLAALSCLYFAKALSGSYMKSAITQIERRFDIPSSLIGVVDGSFEIGNLFVIVFVSYFGAKFHRPRIIAAGSVVMAIGTILIASPHFFMGRYNYETALTFSNNLTTSTSQCSNMSNSVLTPEPGKTSSDKSPSGCEKVAGSSTWIYIFLGNILRGIGETPTGPLGISYLDDYAREENTSFYIGILYTVALIGPLFGYLLGSFCAKIFVDIGFVDLERVTITSKDARWVGAWWLGFLIAGAFSLLFSIPFWFFPKSLTKETRKKEIGKTSEKTEFIKLDQSELIKNNPKPKTATQLAKGFFSSLKVLFANNIYVLYLVSMVIQMNSLIGMLTFKPKFIEQQYGQSASRSNFIIGLINIPAVCIGFFLGGFVMKKFKLSIVQAAKLAIGCSTLGWLLSLSYFGMGCENSRVAGLTISYEGTSQVSYEGSALYHNCNAGCFCPGTKWEPVCAGTGVTYVSPCLAGCKTSTGTGKNTVFHNCSCISAFTAGNSSALLGQCPRTGDCGNVFIYFMAVTVFASFSYCFGAVPGFMILLRCNEPELKSLAIGIHTLLGRTLAGIPAPIYFGALIDTTCLKWGTNRCGGRGACRIYNSDTFR